MQGEHNGRMPGECDDSDAMIVDLRSRRVRRQAPRGALA